jgi:hypothetical protein
MNTILEIALGLVFVFLLFSLLVSAINEAVFGHLTHLRARVLEDSLYAILSRKAQGFSFLAWLRRGFKPPPAGPGTFAAAFLQHPLVQGLAVGKSRCPAYLPAKTFVDAALGTLLNLGATQGSPPGALELDKICAADLANAVHQLSDDHARQVLSSVLVGAEDLDEARQRLEAWFNNSMERVSGLYKRYTQFWLYFWATLLVFCLNLDTIELTRRLMADAQFRGALAAGAVSFAERANSTSMVAGTNGAITPSAAVPNATPSASEIAQEITKLNLPIGWGACTNQSEAPSVIGWVLTRLPRLEQPPDSMNTNSIVAALASGSLSAAAPCPTTPEGWWLKLIGLIITIAAISQGAPFWFDMLNRVTNLRAAGKPPQSSQDAT